MINLIIKQVQIRIFTSKIKKVNMNYIGKIFLIAMLSIQSTSYAEIRSCDDINSQQLKDVIFNQVEKNAIDLNILFPTKIGDTKSSISEDTLLRSKWNEFKNRSKLKILGDVIEERYANPKICTYRLNISLMKSAPNSYRDTAISIRFLVNNQQSLSNTKKENITIENQSWLRLNATMMEKKQDDEFLQSVFWTFQQFLYSEHTSDKLSRDLRSAIYTYFQYSVTDFPGYYKYFEKNYFQIIGEYKDLKGKSNKFIKVISNTDNQIIFKSSACKDVEIRATRDDDAFSYGNLDSQPKFGMYFDPMFLFVADSANKCVENGRYMVWSTYQ